MMTAVLTSVCTILAVQVSFDFLGFCQRPTRACKLPIAIVYYVLLGEFDGQIKRFTIKLMATEWRASSSVVIVTNDQ